MDCWKCLELDGCNSSASLRRCLQETSNRRTVSDGAKPGETWGKIASSLMGQVALDRVGLWKTFLNHLLWMQWLERCFKSKLLKYAKMCRETAWFSFYFANQHGRPFCRVKNLAWWCFVHRGWHPRRSQVCHWPGVIWTGWIRWKLPVWKRNLHYFAWLNFLVYQCALPHRHSINVHIRSLMLTGCRA